VLSSAFAAPPVHPRPEIGPAYCFLLFECSNLFVLWISLVITLKRVCSAGSHLVISLLRDSQLFPFPLDQLPEIIIHRTDTRRLALVLSFEMNTFVVGADVESD